MSRIKSITLNCDICEKSSTFYYNKDNINTKAREQGWVIVSTTEVKKDFCSLMCYKKYNQNPLFTKYNKNIKQRMYACK